LVSRFPFVLVFSFACILRCGMAEALEIKPNDQDVDKQATDMEPQQGGYPTVVYAVSALIALFIFLVGLSLMGEAFKVLGGKGASETFKAINDPIAGVMTGVLATVLVQSSSTSTSIVVAMVGEATISVKMAIPIIMGANIGTTVTNTIVSMGQAGNSLDLQRAFAGATVHDMFNLLAIGTLLPLEVVWGWLQGVGGPLYWSSHAVTETLMGGTGVNENLDFESPLKLMTKPIVSSILASDKYVIYALTLERPETRKPSVVNQTVCNPLDQGGIFTTEMAEQTEDEAWLLGRRLELQKCDAYFCVSKDQDKNFKKISKSSYEELTPCKGFVSASDAEQKLCADDSKCFLDAGSFFDEKVQNGRMIKDGFLQNVGDLTGGIVGLLLSILLLCVGLIGLTKSLQAVFLTGAKRVLVYATSLNGYVAILIGIGITILVQSSSVTTSALTPLCGMGVLPLDKMLPLTLGANIGTCVTALIASLVSFTRPAVQIAMVHLIFNIAGIVIFYPVPFMRQLPLDGARLLGVYAANFTYAPLIYMLVAFLLIPAAALGVNQVLEANLVAGTVLSIIVLLATGVFLYMWNIGMPGDKPLCYKILPEEKREEARQVLERADTLMSEKAAKAAEQSA